MSKRLLFVSHDASRTGAPLALLQLLEWLREKTDWEFTVLLGKAGHLEERFAALAPTYLWNLPRARQHRARRLVDRARTGLGRHPAFRERLLRRLAAQQFDGVYANSAMTASLLPALRAHLEAPILCYVRELEYILGHYVKTAVFRAAQPLVKHYLAASEATRANLLERHGVAERDVTTVYEFIPARRYRSHAAALRSTDARASLGIPPDACVIASGGTLQWRKGPDLFLQTGRRLRERMQEPFVMLWIGGPTGGEDFERLQYDADRLGIADHLRVTGFTDDPLRYFAAADVFLVTSREDPCAIVGLEAAALERPVACFEGSGGMTELLLDGRGFTVPYADADAMADIVVRLQRDSALAADTGRRFADYVCAYHDVEVIAPKIRDLIQRYLLS
jgi:glycosyltransferase involved in cell wall biosynthesis